MIPIGASGSLWTSGRTGTTHSTYACKVLASEGSCPNKLSIARLRRAVRHALGTITYGLFNPSRTTQSASTCGPTAIGVAMQ